jgi:hypothetical protein
MSETELKQFFKINAPSVRTAMLFIAEGELQILPFFPPKPMSSQT